MNTNKQIEKRINKLEQLTPEQQEWILDTALHSTLVDMTLALREQGVDTSPASLCRFIQKHQEKKLLERRQESAPVLNALAEGGREGKLREGTLEAVRQRLYERALVSQSPEEALELYAAMVKEEMKLKEMELEARKVAAMEQQVKLQGVKIQVLAQSGGGKGRVKTELASSEPVEEKATTVAQLTEGERAKQELGGPGGATLADAEREKFLAVLREVDAEINRGGPPEDKVIAVRAVMKRERKLIGVGG